MYNLLVYKYFPAVVIYISSELTALLDKYKSFQLSRVKNYTTTKFLGIYIYLIKYK